MNLSSLHEVVRGTEASVLRTSEEMPRLQGWVSKCPGSARSWRVDQAKVLWMNGLSGYAGRHGGMVLTNDRALRNQLLMSKNSGNITKKSEKTRCNKEIMDYVLQDEVER